MHQFESIHAKQPEIPLGPRIDRREITKRGLECDILNFDPKYPGVKLTVYAHDPESKIIISGGTHMTHGLPSAQDLSPETLRLIRITFTELQEEADKRNTLH